MANQHLHSQRNDLRFTLRSRNIKQRHARLRLQYELLEPRHLLSAELGTVNLEADTGNSFALAPISWFESFRNVERVPLASLSSVDPSLTFGAAGPLPPATGEWIVQLTDPAASSLRSLHQASSLLSDGKSDFTIISGLGTEGLLLIRAHGVSQIDIESGLKQNTNVQSFSLNQLIQGQATTPNDPEFVAGLLTGLERVDAKNAWDVSRGNLSTVVGVVDTGIDPKHPDLYLNIWINQGELPPKFLDASGNQLVDIDGDGLITFYDLNNATRSATSPYSLTVAGFANGPNAEFVRDLNNNGRVDADDLLLDANWADGRDTDNNGFFDDFFGVNFRAGVGDPFVSNNPSDELGHGTHVAGTIGAIGGNGIGVAGVNWQTSLMSLRILDNNNQGDSGAAIRAINYARQMRERLRFNSAGRVTEGANVRVLNNSWGQPGGFESSLEAAIEESYETGILFVAAAGNGNILGNGVDNDRTPFYPASYDVPNVIAVSASDSTDRLATFSNFGKTSVDLLAPGVGIRSTLPGGAYGSANGTSMASPHVAGTAALIWASLPEATVDEVKQAILSTVTPIASAMNIVGTAGRLNISGAINTDVFAPAARLVAKQDITTAGGTTTEFTVEYSHRSGINIATIGNNDLVVTRQWGPRDRLAAFFKSGSIVQSTKTTTATYTVTAPDGTWDPLDFGDYLISTIAGNVASLIGNQLTQSREIGRFSVRINAPAVIYVDRLKDSLDSGTLRSAIIAANAAAPSPRTIILNSGKYTIDISPLVDQNSRFGTSLVTLGLVNPGGWSDASSGDFDIQGNVRIVGDTNDNTVIDAQGLDRVFKVHQGSSLSLSRLKIQGGVSPETQGGGGILSLGLLTLEQVIAKKNTALGLDASRPIFGGAIAAWAGHASLNESWITENQSDFGAALYYGGSTTGDIQRSTLDTNQGGGLYSASRGNISVANSTFSANSGGYGAIANGIQNGFLFANFSSNSPSVSTDGRYVSFQTDASDLVPGDNNRTSDIFLYDSVTTVLQRVSVSNAGTEGNGVSDSPALSDDGRYVTFRSDASNLVPGDTNGTSDIFVYDSTTKTIQRVSVNDAGVEGDDYSDSPSMSADGRYVTFRSDAINLVPDDSNGASDIFVYNVMTKMIQRVSVNDDGEQGDRSSFSPALSGDARYVTFRSQASNLVSGDSNDLSDIFVFDSSTKMIQRVSISDAEEQGDGNSFSPTLSDDGRYVTFESEASNLAPDDSNDRADIFYFDRMTNMIQRVSVNAAGEQGDGHSRSPSLSGDGRYVAFRSDASNLVAGDNNGSADIFVYDTVTKEIQRVSVSNAGVEGKGSSGSPSLSADGRYVTFASDASNLVSGDTNEHGDIFVYDLVTKTIEPITYRTPRSLIDVWHTTVAFTSIPFFDAAVYGDVRVNNSLFVSNDGTTDFNTRAASDSANNVASSSLGSSFISSLQRPGNLPPVHHLIAGNPAINAANPASDGSRDQLGQVRIQADAGALEAMTATVSGKAFVDSVRNGRLDTGESGIPDVVVNITGVVEAVVISRHDDPQTPSVNESGVLDVPTLAVGTYLFTPQPIPNWSVYTPLLELIHQESLLGNGNSTSSSLSANGRIAVFMSDANNLVPDDNNDKRDIFVYDAMTKLIERVSVSDAYVEGNGDSISPSLSADGRYVAFHSFASNLVEGDNDFKPDIFVYDRTTKKIQRISASDAGVAGDDFENDSPPSLSEDGRYVAFRASASDLVPGNHNFFSDIYVYDRMTMTFQQASVNNNREEGNGPSDAPSLSADGRYVTFTSLADNLVPGDSNLKRDVFVYDLMSKTIRRVSVSDTGAEGNSHSSAPSLSADGRYVTFESQSSNLVPGDNNRDDNDFFSGHDVFLYDSMTKKIQRVSVTETGMEANGNSDSPSLSADGRFVTFHSSASNLVFGDTNEQYDVFVYDLLTKSVHRVSISDHDAQGNGPSSRPSLSADGRFMAFDSLASNLVPGDNNRKADVFIVPNPIAEPGVTLKLQAGEVVTDLNFALIPDPGSISGRIFEDSVENGVFDPGEPAIVGAIVFLDLDGDGLLDDREPSVTTKDDGAYQFDRSDSFRSYSIAVKVQIGFEQIAPGASEQFAWSIFLPPGGVVTDRDFALRRVQSTGQSNSSAVSGRLFDDRDGNGVFDAGSDVPMAGREVYLDVANFGVRDTNEERALTDANGIYSFTGLSASNVAVSTTLDQTLVHVSPLGSNYALQKYPLFNAISPFGNPQSIAAGDFNADGFQDVAVALGEGNKLSLRLNDRAGGFLPSQIDIDLGSGGAGPTSLVVGQFDNNPKLDVALTANYAGNVTVLLNFDTVSKTFASRSYVKVGNEPLDIASGQFAGDAKLDLVVVNKADNSVQLLTNNGSGFFTAATATPSGGKGSSSIVVGNFTGDASMDVAVVHTRPLNTNTPNGGVTILKGNAAGVLTLQPGYYQVGALPIDSVSADFNGDQREDLAVANFSSNSISILLGQADGTFKVQTSILGTASGAFDIAIGDIDNDGDIDVLASNLRDRNISIFRNIGAATDGADVRFEPLENIGLGQFSLAQRMPLLVVNFDKDTSGPGGTGTADIVTIPQQTDTLHVLKNKLVNGTRRVALTGTNTFAGLDFIIKSAVLPPSFREIANPAPIVEDSPEQTVNVDGITKGRTSGPPLQFSVTSSNTALIANPTISRVGELDQATVHYVPIADANGTTIITVRAIDAGADTIFGTLDDGIFERSFTVTVLEVDDPMATSIVLEGTGETFDLATTPGSLLSNISLIDVRGTGRNSLILSMQKIKSSMADRTLTIVADQDDAITFGIGWKMENPIFRDGVFTHVIKESATGGTSRIELRNNRMLQNPLSAFDSDRDGKILALDALRVINELRRRGSGAFTLPTQDSEISKLYFDVNGDNRLTALDALRIINAIARINRGGSAEGESLQPLIDLNPFVPLPNKSNTSNVDTKPLTSLEIRPKNKLSLSSQEQTAPTVSAIDDWMRDYGAQTTDEDEPLSVSRLGAGPGLHFGSGTAQDVRQRPAKT